MDPRAASNVMLLAATVATLALLLDARAGAAISIIFLAGFAIYYRRTRRKE